MRHQVLAVVALGLALTACAERPAAPVLRGPAPGARKSPPARIPTPAPAPAPSAASAALAAEILSDRAPPPVNADRAAETPDAFANLPGWRAEDHAAAFAAFVASCPEQHDPAAAAVCARAANLVKPSDTAARRFLEANFKPEAAQDPGLLTAYFTPIYDAKPAPDAEFSAPVRPRPADLPAAPAPGSYADRARIERRPAEGALAWMRPEDLFFLQIQGAGVLVMPDGTRLRAVVDGTNGAPFVGIARPLRQQGLLPADDTSGDAIHAWLAANRGRVAQAMMDLDPRYVFFRLEPDDGLTPLGAAGARLLPGRALAVDPTLYPMGEVMWIDAEAPTLAGAFPAYRRLAVALDVGGAIKGEGRADLYLGEGPAAGEEAGRVRHVLKLYRLEPLADAGS
jgi:membrane-bound lytic murein transglycosylase A